MGSAVSYVGNAIGPLGYKIARFFIRHPNIGNALLAAMVGLAIGGTAVGIIALIGFTPAGVAAGSLAAVIQASIGSVAAGSVFAVLQSLMATGAIWTILGVTVPGAVMMGQLRALLD
ncbi:hypothetical protein DFH27DRAFT_643322 [Peziza echinospora]|nr:hypothetical protein DFH27DRAFT_643322 [Peziza echinospora]